MAGQDSYSFRVFKTSYGCEKSANMAGVDGLCAKNIKRRLLTIIAAALAGKTIGSGQVEKGIDLTIGSRQKHRGMSWLPKGSKALCLLKVTELNGRWQQLWFPTQQA